ncbi:arginine--tRNA ligase [candidate division KSB1 bacterium]|nr:arginine--tRNA ligase [candidate division KSB1 bacterium]
MAKSNSRKNAADLMQLDMQQTTRPARPVHQNIAKLARRSAKLALEKKAADIKIFDVSRLTSIADFFVICTGGVDSHVRAISEHIVDALKKEDVRPWHIEGRERNQWVLIDFVDVVVHVFQPETRDYYGLERLWGDAVIEEIRDEPQKAIERLQPKFHKNMNPSAESYLHGLLTELMQKRGWPIEPVSVGRPRQEGFGDYATPVAMGLAKTLKKAPRLIAEEIVNSLEYDRDVIEEIRIDGPGFINFRFGPGYWQNVLAEILQTRERYGRSTSGAGKNINMEFVSANPTGPLNIVSARAASIGDVLVNLFHAIGAEAKREFYINDAGQRVRMLGYSVSSRYMALFGVDEPFPEDGYHGEYIKDLAASIRDEFGDRFVPLALEARCDQLTKIALERMIRAQRETLEKFRVKFDLWFSEESLLAGNRQQEVLDRLAEKSLSYEKDGALWFRSSQFGDEQDRVLLKSDGEPTYFLGDIAYHTDKYRRGFDQLYDLWGPDHHSHVARMKAAMEALGYEKDSFQVRIIQQVNLLRGGEVVKMSKRAGNIIEMAELIDEVGADAARYFFLVRKLDTPMDFDIDLAKKQTDENPVYYVQYAHARVCNILAHAADKGISLAEHYDLSLLKTPEELAVLKKLAEFPEAVSKAAQFLEPNRITLFLQELAATFHHFYHDHRVVSEDAALTQARLRLVEGVRIVLANALSLLNITAPEKM